MYKVIVGAFGSKENAQARARELHKKGFGTFIDSGKA